MSSRKIYCVAYVSIVLLSYISLSLNFAKGVETVKTWIVDDDGPADFRSIQEAVNAASIGDTIYVKAGTYDGNIVINKTVSLIGEDKQNTIVQAYKRWNSRAVIQLTANNVNVNFFTVIAKSSSYYDSCILIDHSRGNNISHNILRSNDVGIHLLSSNSNSLTNNNAKTIHLIGISLQDSSYNTIVNNTVSNFPDATGILITNNSNNNVVAGNNLSQLHAGITLEDCSNNLIGDNIVSDNELGICLQSNCDNNTIVDNEVSRNDCGIEIDVGFNSNNVIYHNEFLENTLQIRVSSGQVKMDKGYPTGGNHWSGWADEDLYSGPCQNETGSDGIFDNPYVINEDNMDHYPIVPEFPAWTSIMLLLLVLTIAVAIDVKFPRAKGT